MTGKREKSVLDPQSVSLLRATVFELYKLLGRRNPGLKPATVKELLRRILGCLRLLPPSTKIYRRTFLEDGGFHGCPEWPVRCGPPCA
jgi:hypothetical protein